MRPNNQNKNRSRGRNGGRKHQNPLSRNYESNGPDVKIRGNASHIAEKYVQLARDAQASGDSVMAENYLQHAEHYFRIILAAQAQTAGRNEASQDSSGSQNETDDEEGGSETAPAAKGKDEAPAKTASEPADAEAGADKADAAEKPKTPRRPRRRKVTETAEAEAGSSDPASAPQPDVGELPAFLTGGQSSAAE